MLSSIEDDRVTKVRGCTLKLEKLALEEARAMRMEPVPKQKVCKLARGIDKYAFLLLLLLKKMYIK